MTRRIYSSHDIALEEKEEILRRLKDEDKSDWTDKTKAYCEAAIPL